MLRYGTVRCGLGQLPYLPGLSVCSKGPKSLVALDFLYDRFERVYCIEGGITAWAQAKLPTEATRPGGD